MICVWVVDLFFVFWRRWSIFILSFFCSSTSFYELLMTFHFLGDCSIGAS